VKPEPVLNTPYNRAIIPSWVKPDCLLAIFAVIARRLLNYFRGFIFSHIHLPGKGSNLV
jgi:hypothetical protein